MMVINGLQYITNYVIRFYIVKKFNVQILQFSIFSSIVFCRRGANIEEIMKIHCAEATVEVLASPVNLFAINRKDSKPHKMLGQSVVIVENCLTECPILMQLNTD